MCYSPQLSLLFGVIGLLSSFNLYNKNIYASIGIGYFALMEILQYYQYKVIDQCDNNYNKFLTNIGYLHICFQPVFVNLWLFAFTEKHNFTFIYMSLFAGVLLASRLFFVEDKELCDGNNEMLCGEKTCTFSGKRHLSWNLRLRAPGKNWWTPSMGLHFFMWTIPVLTMFELKPILAMLLIGPYLAYFLIVRGDDRKPGETQSEAATIWCYTILGQIFFTNLFLNK
tara:strand:+ start:127 stop:804 length:678 start_codon:yes stop_codon:yes gene_type:complete